MKTERPGFLRRLLAMLYDALLLFSVLFFATAAVLPLNDGEAIPSHHPLYTAYLLGASFLYFAWFWTHGGQTLGMRAWKLRLRRRGGLEVTWRCAGLRFAAALLSWLAFGAGFLWALLDRERMTWHDRLSGTVLVLER